jgi:hypothetical protein
MDCRSHALPDIHFNYDSPKPCVARLLIKALIVGGKPATVEFNSKDIVQNAVHSPNCHCDLVSQSPINVVKLTANNVYNESDSPVSIVATYAPLNTLVSNTGLHATMVAFPGIHTNIQTCVDLSKLHTVRQEYGYLGLYTSTVDNAIAELEAGLTMESEDATALREVFSMAPKQANISRPILVRFRKTLEKMRIITQNIESITKLGFALRPNDAASTGGRVCISLTLEYL